MVTRAGWQQHAFQELGEARRHAGQERRALGLARLAGAEGEPLASAIFEETERLLAAEEQAFNPQPASAAAPPHPPPQT
jgi:hypothetical protein